MTNFLFRSSLLFLTIFCSAYSKAQTTVYAGSATDYSAVVCSLPASMTLTYSGGQVTGYNDVTDNMVVKIYWGDGNDTTFIVDLINGGGTDYFDTSITSTYYHNYQLPGTYSPMITATGPDGNADTTYGNAITYSTSCTLIDGYAYEDVNSNCTYDAGDHAIPNAMIKISNSVGNILYIAYADSVGYFHMDVVTGLTGLHIAGVSGIYLTTVCPVAGEYIFNSNVSQSFNLGIDCSATTADLHASHTGMCGIGAPGSNGQMAITASVTGCSGSGLIPATITLTIDPSVHYVSMVTGPPPTTIIGNVLTWDYVFNVYSGFGTGFNATMITYTDTTVVVGSSSCWDIDITSSVVTDTYLSNNHEHTCLTVDGPWDPNSKEVNPIGVGPTGDVLPDTEFYYLLNFQNTGNMPAIHIKVRDTLSDNLDMNTFEITGSSHFMNPIFSGSNIVVFDFPGINLPDSNANEPASHGWITYRVKAKSGLPAGTQIKNTGYIFFDYNPAVVTNTTINTINPFLSINENSTELGNTLFPNPANNTVTINFNDIVNGTLKITDITGRTVSSLSVNNTNQLLIPLHDLPAGIYNVSMSNGIQLKQNRLQIIK